LLEAQKAAQRTGVRELNGAPKTNRQKFVALSSLAEGLSLKVTGIKCPQTSDASFFANGAAAE